MFFNLVGAKSVSYVSRNDAVYKGCVKCTGDASKAGVVARVGWAISATTAFFVRWRPFGGTTMLRFLLTHLKILYFQPSSLPSWYYINTYAWKLYVLQIYILAADYMQLHNAFYSIFHLKTVNFQFQRKYTNSKFGFAWLCGKTPIILRRRFLGSHGPLLRVPLIPVPPAKKPWKSSQDHTVMTNIKTKTNTMTQTEKVPRRMG